MGGGDRLAVAGGFERPIIGVIIPEDNGVDLSSKYPTGQGAKIRFSGVRECALLLWVERGGQIPAKAIQYAWNNTRGRRYKLGTATSIEKAT